jgi:hypothetical protein
MVLPYTPIKKGNFKKNGENVKLLINSVEQPIIYITTNTNQKFTIHLKTTNQKNLRPTKKMK